MLLVVLAVLGGTLALQHADRTVAVYATATSLSGGATLSAADLRVTRVRLDPAVLRNYLRPGAPYVGWKTQSALAAGLLVPVEAVADGDAGRGLVQVPLPADSFTALPASLFAPGDKVRVVQNPATGDAKAVAADLGVAEVYRVDTDQGGLGTAAGPTSITLSVDAAGALRLSGHPAEAKLSLIRLPRSTPLRPGAVAVPTAGAGAPSP